MKTETKLSGVIVEKRRTKRYISYINKAGYTVKQIIIGEKNDTIQVELPEEKMNEFAKMIAEINERNSNLVNIR